MLMARDESLSAVVRGAVAHVRLGSNSRNEDEELLLKARKRRPGRKIWDS